MQLIDDFKAYWKATGGTVKQLAEEAPEALDALQEFAKMKLKGKSNFQSFNSLLGFEKLILRYKIPAKEESEEVSDVIFYS